MFSFKKQSLLFISLSKQLVGVIILNSAKEEIVFFYRNTHIKGGDEAILSKHNVSLVLWA